MTAVSDHLLIFELLDDLEAIAGLKEVFDGEQTFSRKVEDRSDWTLEVEGGFSRATFNQLFTELIRNCDGNSIFIENTRNILEPPRSTGTTVSIVSTMFAVRVASFYVALRKVLGNSNQAVRFLISRHPELNAMTPMEAALTTNGAQNVFSIISRGVHGLPA
jgi:hypothetical protein